MEKLQRVDFEKIIKKVIEAGLIIFAIGSPFSISLAQMGFICALVFWILKIILLKEFKLKGTFIDMPLLIYLIGLTLSSCFSVEPLKSLKANHNIWLFSMIYLIVNNADFEFSKKLLNILLISSILSGLYGIFQTLTGIDFIRGSVGKYGRYFYGAWGGFGLHLTYGGYQMMIALILLSIAIYGSEKLKIRSNILIKLSALIVVLSVIGSFARTAWAGLLAGLLVLMILGFQFKNKIKSLIILGMLVIIIISVFVVPDIKERILYTFYELKRDEGRHILYQIAWKIIKEHPIFGVGSGMFSYHFFKYRPNYTDACGHPHNDFLAAYLRAGLIGFIGYLLIFFVYIFNLSKLFLKLVKNDERNSAIIAGFIASIISFMVAGLGQNYFTDSENAMLLWFIYGISFVIYKNFSEKLKKEI